MRSNILLIALGAMQGVQSALLTCNADNCLRAVRNTAMTARGSADCASYFAPTVTAPATTIIKTVTVTSSPSSSSTATEINTVTYGTVTSTELDTLTITPVTTVTSTISTETEVATSVVFVRRDGLSANTIPAYASAACSGVASRYSSACACISVTGSTVTVPGPTSYTTVTSTQTLPAALVLTTQTLFTTVPASTTTETDVSTIYAAVVTSVVNVDASTTVTTLSTSTTSQPTPTFCLIGSLSGADYVFSHSGSSGANIIVKAVGTTTYPTVMFTFDSAGHLVSVGGLKAYIPYPFNNPQVLRLAKDSSITSNPSQYAVLTCSGTVGGALACSAAPPGSSSAAPYAYFYKSLQNAPAVMGSTSNLDIQNPTYFASISWILSTTCPA